MEYPITQTKEAHYDIFQTYLESLEERRELENECK